MNKETESETNYCLTVLALSKIIDQNKVLCLNNRLSKHGCSFIKTLI